MLAVGADLDASVKGAAGAFGVRGGAPAVVWYANESEILGPEVTGLELSFDRAALCAKEPFGNCRLHVGDSLNIYSSPVS